MLLYMRSIFDYSLTDREEIREEQECFQQIWNDYFAPHLGQIASRPEFIGGPDYYTVYRVYTTRPVDIGLWSRYVDQLGEFGAAPEWIHEFFIPRSGTRCVLDIGIPRSQYVKGVQDRYSDISEVPIEERISFILEGPDFKSRDEIGGDLSDNYIYDPDLVASYIDSMLNDPEMIAGKPIFAQFPNALEDINRSIIIPAVLICMDKTRNIGFVYSDFPDEETPNVTIHTNYRPQYPLELKFVDEWPLELISPRELPVDRGLGSDLLRKFGGLCS